jgi:hypothetical protein
MKVAKAKGLNTIRSDATAAEFGCLAAVRFDSGSPCCLEFNAFSILCLAASRDQPKPARRR